MNNAFVTGGSRGIGRAVVLKLVADGVGCAFTYRNDAAAAEETIELARQVNRDLPVRAYQMDLADPAQIEATVQRAIDDFESIRIVVNNAGKLHAQAAVLTTNEDWAEIMAANLSGPFYVTREFLMHIISQKQGGRIIMISSVTHDGASGQSAYATSKAGLIGLANSLAKEYGPKKITTNVVAPGFIETDMTAGGPATKMKDFWVQFCPLRRTGQGADVANVVGFLASEAGSFVNGEVIHVSGGLNYVP